jgi:outer membrane lipoprotein-sorting protein
MGSVKKVLSLAAVLMIVILLAAGCGKRQINVEDTLDFLKNLDEYSTNIDMEILNDKQNITYTGKQIYCKNIGYRFELNGERVLLYIGDKIYVRDNVSKTRYETSKDFDSLYKITFIGEYINLLYTNEEIKSTVKDIDGSRYQIIELAIPGANRNMQKAELYVNLKQLYPEKLIVYDNKNKATVRVNYKNFTPNVEVDKNLFEINGMEIEKQN